MIASINLALPAAKSSLIQVPKDVYDLLLLNTSG